MTLKQILGFFLGTMEYSRITPDDFDAGILHYDKVPALLPVLSKTN